MKDYIKRLARGEFEYKIPVLESIQSLQSQIIEDSENKFTFEVKASGEITGTVYSTNPRVHTSGAFRGDITNVEILVDSIGSRPGDEIEGLICVVTSAGQKDVPFKFSVIRKKITGDGYSVEDMESFSELASSDIKKAEEVFIDPQFANVVLRDNVRLNALYEELVPKRAPGFALRNFLAASGREKYIPDIEHEEKKPEGSDTEERTGKTYFSEFISKWNRLKIELTRGYLDFRMKKISIENWIIHGLDIISRPDFLNLYNLEPEEKRAYLEMNVARAMLLALKGEGEDAKRLIVGERDGLLEDRQKAGVLYYTAMYIHTIAEGINGDIESARKEFFNAIDKSDTPWQVLIYQYHLDKDAEENASIWLTRFKDAFNKGCTSPILYLEAIRIINRQPALLRVLNAFETQVIRFAYRYKLMESNATTRFTELVSEENKTDLTHLHCLKCLYDEYNSDEILVTLCSKMIMENLIGERYAPVYERAIKRQLKITRLFEYYLMSICGTEVKKIPEMVLRYFVYDSGIDQNVKAYLYAYMVNIRNEEPEIFSLYRNNIILFTKERLANGFIDDYLIVLYRWLWDEETRFIDENYALQIFKLRHTYKVNIGSDKPVSMRIRHLKFNRSRNVPIKDCCTYAFILADTDRLDKECVITFEDRCGNIYTDKAFEYRMEKILDSEHPVILNEELCVSDPFYNLSKYKEALAAQDEAGAIVYAKSLIVYDWIAASFEEELRQVIYGGSDVGMPSDGGPDSVIIKSQNHVLAELEDELTRMLFIKEGPEITGPVFSKIRDMGGKGLVEDAYVAYQAFLYFVKEKPADDQIFDIILKRVKDGKKQLPLELAALLKHNAASSAKLNEEEAKLYGLVLEAFLDKGYVLEFFKDINKAIKLPELIGDKTVIEYRDLPDQSIWFDFSTGRLKGKRIKAKEMFCGIYTYVLTLFENEKAEFTVNVINEEKLSAGDNGAGNILCHGQVYFDNRSRSEDHVFTQLNKISRDLAQPAYRSYGKDEHPGEGAKEALDELLADQALNRQMFEII